LHGQVFNEPAKAEETVEAMKSLLALISSRLEGIDDQDKKTALELFGQPNKVGGNQGTAQILFDLIKVDNLGQAWPKDVVDISLEKLVDLNPDILFIFGPSPYDSKDLSRNAQLRQIKAIESNSVYKLPVWSTYSPRLASLAALMAQAAYPDKFEDLNINKIIQEYLLKIFGVETPAELK
jgi:iron complex transport system substrate-binding protein